jgi:hypothetical protein
MAHCVDRQQWGLFLACNKSQQSQYSGEAKLNQHWLIMKICHFGAIVKSTFFGHSCAK